MKTNRNIKKMYQTNKNEVQQEFMDTRKYMGINSVGYFHTLVKMKERNTLKYLLYINDLTDSEKEYINSLLQEDLAKKCFRIKIERQAFDGNDYEGLMFTKLLGNQIIEIEDNEAALIKFKELLSDCSQYAFDFDVTNYGYIEIAHYVDKKPVLTKLSLSHYGNQVYIDTFLESMYVLDNES